MKQEITFHDKNGDKIKIEIEIKDGRFSMSGETGSSAGQCYDSIQATPNQQKLMDLWKKYHLNDMNAGTIKQEQVITDYRNKHNIKGWAYEKELLILDSTNPNLQTLNSLEVQEIQQERDRIKKENEKLEKDKKTISEKLTDAKKNYDGWFIIKTLDIKYFFHNHAQLHSFVKKELAKRDKEIQELQEQFNKVALKTMLYDVHPETGKPYKYGTSWLKRELPNGLWETVNQVCIKINADEKRRKNKYKGGNWDDLDKKVEALGKYLKMTPKEAEESIEERDNHEYTAEGVDYIVGTDEEMNKYCKEYLTNDTELYKMWVEQQIKEGNASGIINIDDWADYVINSDGYGQILNHWDGSEHYNSDLELFVIRK